MARWCANGARAPVWSIAWPICTICALPGEWPWKPAGRLRPRWPICRRKPPALRVAELLAVLGADAVLTHSSFERALLRQEAPGAKAHLVPWEVAPRPTAVPFAQRRGVAFIGSYGHAPNLDAAHLLVERIMPLVWAGNPDIDCVLAGSDLPASLREAARQAPAGRVDVLGHVASPAQLWDRVRLAAAPLRYGAGLKGKVLDALAGGLPCVMLPMAAEGMDLPATLAPLVAPDPQAAAATILRLHDAESECAALRAAGLDFIRARFGTASVDTALADAVGAVQGVNG